MSMTKDTKESDTNRPCNSIPYGNSRDSSSWTVVGEQRDEVCINDFKENFKQNARLTKTFSIGLTVNNVEDEEMENNYKTLRTKSLEFFQESKYQRECEWTSHYFGRENFDGLLSQDKHSNGNYKSLATRNTNKASNEVICEHYDSSLCKLKNDGIAVFDRQGKLGTSDQFEAFLFKSCATNSDDNSMTSKYVDIQQVGDNVHGYGNGRESYPASLCQEPLSRNVNIVCSHETQWPRNALKENLEKCFDKELQPVKNGVVLYEKESDFNFETKNLDPWDDGLIHDATTPHGDCAAGTNQAKNQVQEDVIVPVTMQREPIVLTWFEESVTPHEDEHRKSFVFLEDCVTINENNNGSDEIAVNVCNEGKSQQDKHRRFKIESEEIVVNAVCSGSGKCRPTNGDDSDTVSPSTNREDDDSYIRLTSWHDNNGCHGDGAANWFLLSSNITDTDDSCHGNIVKSFIIRNSASDFDEHEDNASCHGNDSTGLQKRNIGNEIRERDADDDNDGSDDGNNDADRDVSDDRDARSGGDRDDDGDCNDDHDYDDRMKVNGGNPFDLDESEFQKLIQSIDNSSDANSDYYLNDQCVRPQENSAGVCEEMDPHSIENSSCNRNNDTTCLDESHMSESQGPFNVVGAGGVDDGNVDVNDVDDNGGADGGAAVGAAEGDVNEAEVVYGNGDDEDEGGGGDINDDDKCDDNDKHNDNDNDKTLELQEHSKYPVNDNNLSRDSNRLSTNISPRILNNSCVTSDRNEQNGNTILETKTDGGNCESYRTEWKRTPTLKKSLFIELPEKENKKLDDNIGKPQVHFQDPYELSDREVSVLVESNTSLLEDMLAVEAVNEAVLQKDCQNAVIDCGSTPLVEANTNSLDDGVTVEDVNEAVLQKDCQNAVIDCGSTPLVEANTNSLDDGVTVEDVNEAVLQKDCQNAVIDCGSTPLNSLAPVKERAEKESEAQENSQENQEQNEFNIPVVVLELSNDAQENNTEYRLWNPLESQIETHDDLKKESTENMQHAQPSSDRVFIAENSFSVQERIQKVNKAFEWVRTELQEMRILDFNLKVQFDSLRQEMRTLREEYELYINCEYYDDDEICAGVAESSDLGKDPTVTGQHCDTPLKTGLREDSGYSSDSPLSSTKTRLDNGATPTYAHAKYYYQPLPTYPKIQELNNSNCVFELVL